MRRRRVGRAGGLRRAGWLAVGALWGLPVGVQGGPRADIGGATPALEGRVAEAGVGLTVGEALPVAQEGAAQENAAQDVLPRPGDADRPIVIGSKPFAESFVLGEIFGQLLEARGFHVDRRPGLGSTEITFQALRTGAIDLYPEYTGTGVQAILGESPEGGGPAVYRRVSREFRERWGLRWLPPLGFENTYAIAVRSETAEARELRTLSDLAAVAPDFVAGLTPDFIGRADGLPGLAGAYGLEFGEIRPLVQALKYEAIEAGEVEVIDGYSTDAGIDRLRLVVLKDDRAFFPPYQAAALAGRDLAEARPAALAALAELSGRIEVSAMRRMNAEVEVEGRTVEAVAADFLREIGLVDDGSTAPSGSEDSAYPEAQGPVEYLLTHLDETRDQTLRHLFLVGVSLGLALLLALPLGLALERVTGATAEGVIRGAGLLQTIPSIALLAFMIPLLGIGVTPAIGALFLYSLFPILRNTYTGVRDADPEAVAAGKALGMTPAQILLQIRLPLAAPVLMAGIRTAAVINVGTATLAAFIGAGGLGDPIVAGLALADANRVFAGAVPAAILALFVDLGLAGVERAVTPRGLRPGGEPATERGRSSAPRSSRR